MATIPGTLSDQNLSSNTKTLINQFVFVGGNVTEAAVDGGVLVRGQGGNQNGSGVPENQALFINKGTDAPVTATLEDDVLTVTVTLPPGVDLGVSGPSTPINANQMAGYINDLIEKALGTNADTAAYKASLEQAVATLQKQIDGQEVVVRVVSFADGSGAASGSVTTGTASTGNNVVFDAGSSAGNELFALRLDQVQDGNSVTLKNVENAMLVGSGTVIVDGDEGARVVGDNANQKITGSAGNDTLVGGGGNDTLVGGAGDDVLGFNAIGHYTLEGFGNGADKLAFDFTNVTSLNELLSYVSDVVEADGNVTYVFDQGAASITLIGVSANEISAEMVKFSL